MLLWLVITEEETRRVERFVEMTRTFVVYKINAGIYLLGQHHCAHDVIGSAFAGCIGHCNIRMQSWWWTLNWFPLQSLHDKWENKGHAVFFSFFIEKGRTCSWNQVKNDRWKPNLEMNWWMDVPRVAMHSLCPKARGRARKQQLLFTLCFAWC